jgi:hypothetical protein
MLKREIARDLEQEIPMKKMPAPAPKIEGVKPRSWFMARAANPTLTWSRKYTA